MSTKKANEPRPKKKLAAKKAARKKTTLLAKVLEEGRVAYMAGDFAKAHGIWLVLAEAGTDAPENAEAQAWIGSLYANGDGVDVDDAAAFAWYLKSADGGNVQAQSNIGAMYAMGNGVTADDVKAVGWFERAAEAGDAHGQFNLAVLLSEGRGVEKDLAKAAEWYQAAAEMGHYPSQARLGHMYSTGHGVEKNRVQAFLWLSLAAQHGIGTALNALEAISNQMSSEEKAEALGLFDAWRGRTAASAGPSRIVPLPG